MSDVTVLVTGATGTVGSQVVRELLDKGVRFRAGVHTRPLDIDGVESHAIDFDRPETLPPALEGVRTVFLVSPDIFHERAMIEAARDAGVERIVKISSFGTADEAVMVTRWHREVEREVERSGMAWTFVRPNYLMQNFVTVHGESIRKENAFYDSVGDARISHIDAQDVGRVAARVLTESGHEGKAYDVSGPEAITHEEAAHILSRTLGRTIRYVRLSDEELRQRLLSQGVPERFIEALTDSNANSAGEGLDSLVTMTVQDLTGRAPTSFAEFCREYAPALAAS